MSIHELVLYPDTRLRQCVKEEKDATDRLRARARDMLATMYANNGIGLAAPQIGVMSRLIVMDCAGDEKPEPIVMINPRRIASSEETKKFEEGCLSFPEHRAEVSRPASVCIEWLDIDGNMQKRDFDELWAVCVQHEIDHLDGRLFIDYITPLRRDIIIRKMKKYKRELVK